MPHDHRLARRSLHSLVLTLPFVLCFGEPSAEARPRSQRLFTISRSKNKNLVCYDVRFRKDGSPDPAEPIAAYWLMAAEDGRREGLTWLERELAYGVQTQGEVNAARFRVQLKALQTRALSVERLSSGSYEARLTIAGKRAALRRIHVVAQDSAVMPRVSFIDVFGSALATGAPLVERIKP